MTKLEARARELAEQVMDPRGDGDHAVTADEIAAAMVQLAREHAKRALRHAEYDGEYGLGEGEIARSLRAAEEA